MLIAARLRRFRAASVALFAALVAALLIAVPAPAFAHEGPMELEITPDGAGGISVIATYINDGHISSVIIDPVATAESDDGRTAGPVSLISSSEGEGIWITEEPFLDDGNWTVTVTTSTPEHIEATAQFEVAPLAAPIEAKTVTDDASSESGGGADFIWLIGGAALGLVLVAAVVAFFVRRGKSRYSDD